MTNVSFKYALSLAAGAALLACASGSAGAVTVSGMLPAITQPALSNAVVGDEAGAPKVENVWWHYGYGYHWHPHYFYHPRFFFRPVYHYGWHRGFCYWHPRACGY